MTESYPSLAAQDRPIPDRRTDQPLSACGALREADEAAWQTRRLLDASRSVLTGNVAMGVCLPATLMVWWAVARDGDISRGIGSLVMIGFAAWVLMSVRWAIRFRSAGAVQVVDCVEVNLNAIRKHPFRRLVPLYALVLGAALGWSYLFKVLPQWGVAVAMWSVVAVMAGLFVGRFARFLFWEDLLFAASIVFGWGLYLVQAWQMAALAILPPLAVVAGTVCLHQRWRNWVRSLPASGAAPAAPEGCS